MKSLIVALASLLVCASAFALPDKVRELAPEWRNVGKGELRWLGLRIYDAELWVSGARFATDQPFALSLRYARSISRERLVDTSIDEMRRLGETDVQKLARWREVLGTVFPNVAPGSNIVGVSLPGRGALFFLDGRQTGAVEDAEFAQAFFGIWLDQRTRDPDLRAQLLGTQ